MDNQTVELVNKTLDKLSTELGVAKEVMWGALIKQAPIDYITHVLQTTLLGISLFIIFKYMHLIPTEFYKENNYRGVLEWHAGGVAMCVVGVVLVFAFIIMLFLCLDITKLINPEYWALSQILDLFKQGE